MKWAYGVTTVEKRRKDLLPRTLKSLAEAGFPSPRLFVDGTKDIIGWEAQFGLDVSARSTGVLTFGHWILSMGELYLRDWKADRYAIFQDDFVTYKNLRGYLERCRYPAKGYCNLYTFPSNYALANNHKGWYPSDQRGKGAVALVFSREALRELLIHQHMVDHVHDPDRGTRAVDGAIVESMRKAGWKEYVHAPSLVQHTGTVSSIKRPVPIAHPRANSFLGENFDAMDLLK